MNVEPKLERGSIWIDLRDVQVGTHSLVLDGREESFTVGEEADRVLRRFRLEGTLSFDGRDYRVRGSLTGNLEIACDRCLTRFGSPVGIEVALLAVAPDSQPAAERPDGDEEVVPIGLERRLDLGEAVREAVLLEVPIKSVCRSDCRGLCPVCGVNRNEESCHCKPRAADPRWEPLRGLSSPSEPKE